MVDIIEMLDQLEEMLKTTPEQRTQREYDRLKNIYSVNRPEAVSTGLAQCCGYARLIHEIAEKQRADFPDKMAQLLCIMFQSCGVNPADIVLSDDK